jgi:predicted nucleic-acid-binding Zn-ribbon protein
MVSNSAKEDFAKLLKGSFADYSCLRCGHGSFIVSESITENMLAPSFEEFTREIADAFSRRSFQDLSTTVRYGDLFFRIVCERCGLSEEHYLPPLVLADKPIMKSGS